MKSGEGRAMKTADITDAMVLNAFILFEKDTVERYSNPAMSGSATRWPYDFLMEETGAPFKVAYRAMERAHNRGLVEYGVSLRSGWLTEAGRRALADASTTGGE